MQVGFCSIALIALYFASAHTNLHASGIATAQQNTAVGTTEA